MGDRVQPHVDRQKIRYWRKTGLLPGELQSKTVKSGEPLDLAPFLQFRRISEWRERGISLQQIRKKILAFKENQQANPAESFFPPPSPRHLQQQAPANRGKQSAKSPPIFLDLGSSAMNWLQVFSPYGPLPQLLAKQGDRLVDVLTGQFFLPLSFEKENCAVPAYERILSPEKHSFGSDKKKGKLSSNRTGAVRFSDDQDLRILQANHHAVFLQGVCASDVEKILELEEQLAFESTGQREPSHSHSGQDSQLQEQKGSSFSRQKRILQEMLEINPAYVPAWTELGNLAFAENEYGQAEEYYIKAINFSAEKPAGKSAKKLGGLKEIFFNLANLYCRQKKYAAAIRHYQECLSLDAGFADAYFNLSLAFVQTGWLDLAIDAMQLYLHTIEEAVLPRSELDVDTPPPDSLRLDEREVAQNILKSLYAQRESATLPFDSDNDGIPD